MNSYTTSTYHITQVMISMVSTLMLACPEFECGSALTLKENPNTKAQWC